MISNTFLVTSAVNSVHSTFTPDERFRQTIETIESIRVRAPGSQIIFGDTSTIPLTSSQVAILSNIVDHYVDINVSLFTRYVNLIGKNKGLNELMAYEKMLDYAADKGCIGHRIFKLSGRYRLSPDFNQAEYYKPHYYGKYCFRITPWVYNEGAGEFLKYFYNTALWSMCYSLVEDYRGLLQKIFNWMLTTGENIEMAHNAHIPKEKLVVLSSTGGEGYITNGEWTEI